jgi:hypothetical protein
MTTEEVKTIDHDGYVLDAGHRVFVRNRGVLRAAFDKQRAAAAAANADDPHGSASAWAAFAVRQAERAAPLPPNKSRRLLPAPVARRLRVEAAFGLPDVSRLPLNACGAGGGSGGGTGNGGVYAFEVAVTLFDAASGAFCGVTSRSLPVQPFVDDRGSGGSDGAAAADGSGAGTGGPVDTATASNAAPDSAKQPQQQQEQQPGQRRLAARFAFDVFWRSRVADAECAAIAEVCLVRRGGDGVAAERFSLGWAALPVATTAAAAAAPLGSGDGAAAAAPAAPPLVAAPVNSGTPRVLLMARPTAAACGGGGGGGSSSSGQPPQPVPIPGCVVAYSVCRWPAAEPALAALAPEVCAGRGSW